MCRSRRGAVKYCRFQVGKTIADGAVEGDRVRQIEGNLFGRHELTEQPSTRRGRCWFPYGPASSGPGRQLRQPPRRSAAQENPELFFKVPSCLVATEAAVVIPPGTAEVHPEGEMVIVIGKRARNVSEKNANEYVFGVTCGNDISARDWQANDVQWWRAKGSDTFGPCGPFIAAGADYDDLLLTTRVNGEVRQSQRTKDLIHGVAAIVSFASRYVTLEPGDLIYTGTPGKTAAIQPGDVVEIVLENVGILRNPIVAGK